MNAIRNQSIDRLPRDMKRFHRHINRLRRLLGRTRIKPRSKK